MFGLTILYKDPRIGAIRLHHQESTIINFVLHGLDL